jgi:hypothetical protein
MRHTSYRWRTPDGDQTAELRSFIKLARTGAPWAEIAAKFYPSRKDIRRACDIFKAHADAEDRAARRRALARRGFNLIGKAGRPRKVKDVVAWVDAEDELAVQIEVADPWASMGMCFR